jgi:hypothetical protein
MTATSFEFSSSDNKLMRSVSLLAGLVSLLSGVLFVVRLVNLVEVGTLINSGLSILNYSDNWVELLSVVLPLVFLALLSFQFLQASLSFRRIVTTAARDIFHLNAATSSLANGLYLVGGFMLISVFRWFVWADETSRCLGRS